MAGIESLARSLLGALTPTGTRSSGVVTVKSVGPGTALVPRNSYLLPVVEGRLREHAIFKIGPTRAPLAANGTGGDWTVTAGGTPVAVVSNLGGARHNVPAATVFRFDPQLTGVLAK